MRAVLFAARGGHTEGPFRGAGPRACEPSNARDQDFPPPAGARNVATGHNGSIDANDRIRRELRPIDACGHGKTEGGRGVEDIRDDDANSQLAQASHQPHRSERVTAESEEIVTRIDVGNLQHTVATQAHTASTTAGSTSIAGSGAATFFVTATFFAADTASATDAACRTTVSTADAGAVGSVSNRTQDLREPCDHSLRSWRRRQLPDRGTEPDPDRCSAAPSTSSGSA